jgi:phosphatidylserine/phosphatidylglycerophosphate/cardiolipin synthase-like enzyme
VNGEIVPVGSFNFTKAAEEKNAENLLVIHDKALAAKCRENWEAHQRRLEYAGRQ